MASFRVCPYEEINQEPSNIKVMMLVV
jgi:hypothetical protein